MAVPTLTLALAITLGSVLLSSATPDGSNAVYNSQRYSGPVYDVISSVYIRDGICFEEFAIKGNGVDDHLKETCLQEGVMGQVQDRVVINESDELYIGSPKDNFCIYGNTINSLLVIRGNRCTKKTYTPFKQPLEEDLSPADCKSKRGRIIGEVLHYQMYKTLPPRINPNEHFESSTTTSSFSSSESEFSKRDSRELEVNGELYYVYLKAYTTEDGKCEVQVQIEGNGVNDYITTQCSAPENMEVIDTAGRVVVRDNKGAFQAISLQANILVVITDKCVKKTFSGGDLPQETEMSNKECTDFRSLLDKTSPAENAANKKEPVKQPPQNSNKPTTNQNQKKKWNITGFITNIVNKFL